MSVLFKCRIKHFTQLQMHVVLKVYLCFLSKSHSCCDVTDCHSAKTIMHFLVSPHKCQSCDCVKVLDFALTSYIHIKLMF